MIESQVHMSVPSSRFWRVPQGVRSTSGQTSSKATTHDWAAAAKVGVGALRELVHDLSGAIPTNWPGPTFAQYRILTRKPRNHDYLFRHVERLPVRRPW